MKTLAISEVELGKQLLSQGLGTGSRQKTCHGFPRAMKVGKVSLIQIPSIKEPRSGSPISGRTRAQHRSIANSAIFTNRTASSETRTRNAGAFDAQASPSPRSGIVKLPDPLVPMTAEWRANIEETVTVTATPMTTYRNLEGRRHGTLLNERKARNVDHAKGRRRGEGEGPYKRPNTSQATFIRPGSLPSKG
jgi:hypothetical protein